MPAEEGQLETARRSLTLLERDDALRREELALKRSAKQTEVESAKIDLTLCECENKSCARLDAGKAHIETRCLKKHDNVCGHDDAFYPPLAKGVNARPAVATEHGYNGDALKATWKESERRGAYVGTFTLQ